jgi:DNA repair protein RadC
MNYRIQDLNKDEKPREKLMKFGATVLSDAELIALLIGSGGKDSSALDTAREILGTFNGLQGLLDTQIQQLTTIKYINEAKACSIYASLEIGLRIKTANNDYLQTEVQKPKDVFSLLHKEMYKKAKEHLYMLSINSRNKLISYDLISVGTVNEALISPREVFKQAFVRNAVGIILAHNHPSGDPDPSDSDISITNTVARSGQLLGIPLIDHIIISDDRFVSLKSLRLLKGNKFLQKGGETSEKN